VTQVDTALPCAIKKGLDMAGTHKHTEEVALLTVRDVARLLNCSPRSVYRLTDSGGMPRPVKLGGLIRWPRQVIETWIAMGCPKAEPTEAVL